MYGPTFGQLFVNKHVFPKKIWEFPLEITKNENSLFPFHIPQVDYLSSASESSAHKRLKNNMLEI